jgi:hypothetical protein
MMFNMLAGQAQSTASTQLLARMGSGFQYRDHIFGTIQKNFWMATILGYVVRLVGSKFWGARMWGAFRYIATICINGTLLLCLVALVVPVVFYASAPWAFASGRICELLETVCAVPVYEMVYGQGFRSSYFVSLVLPQVSALLKMLQACLFAAQDFAFVRNTSLIGLGCFVPLAAAGYHSNSFLLLQVIHAYSIIPCTIFIYSDLNSLKRFFLHMFAAASSGGGGRDRLPAALVAPQAAAGEGGGWRRAGGRGVAEAQQQPCGRDGGGAAGAGRGCRDLVILAHGGRAKMSDRTMAIRI